MWWAVWIGSFWPKIEVFYRPEWTKGGSHDNDFWGFPNSELFQTFRSEKVDEKNGVICLVFMFFSWVIVLKLSKKVHFLQFCADLSTESRSIKAIFIYVFGRYRYALSENDSVYYDITYCFGDISIWNWKNLLKFCWFSIFFDILIAYISWTVARTPINHTTFWKSVIRTFKYLYVNCFNRLRFLGEVSTKL